MRPIRFRAWDLSRAELMKLTSKEFKEKSGLEKRDFSKRLMLPVVQICFSENTVVTDGFIRPMKEFILMQFTGLLDKNGKEIYEGDIFNDDTGWKWKVEYSPCCFYGVSIEKDLRPDYSLTEYDSSIIEVLGNIYENP